MNRLEEYQLAKEETEACTRTVNKVARIYGPGSKEAPKVSASATRTRDGRIGFTCEVIYGEEGPTPDEGLMYADAERLARLVKIAASTGAGGILKMALDVLEADVIEKKLKAQDEARRELGLGNASDEV